MLVPCLPTVLAKYPSIQNSPPQSFFFTPDSSRTSALSRSRHITGGASPVKNPAGNRRQQVRPERRLSCVTNQVTWTLRQRS